MENPEIDAARSRERAESPKNSDRTYGAYADSVSSLLFDDPASFFILCLVQVAEVQRISEVKSYFSKTPDMLPVVDSVLSRMEEANVVRIEGDVIALKSKFVDFGGDPAGLKQFLPTLFRLTANRVLTNEAENPERRKARKEMVRWFALGDNPTIAAEARAIDLEYKAKMVALQEKALRGATGPANGIRFVGIIDCVLDAEDFS